MPLIVFVGISSLGALFLIVFFAALCRDGHHRRCARAGSRAPSTTPLATTAVSHRKRRSNVMVVRQRILCGRPNRLTHVPIDSTQGEVRKAWQ